MRRPVIASRVGGVPEIVLENETGWTINNELTDYWVDKINRAVTDSKLNRKFGNKGREWVSKTFGWNTIARQVEQLILNEAQY
jgi:glycosyltransferase involved in cell wall biosynthesis